MYSKCLRLLRHKTDTKLYFDGSLSPVMFFKLLIPEITYVCHLFLTCYLFSIVNEQKESMNFALYSSDWTDMSVKFKKLLLCTMRMNDAENLKMKISLQRIVDMEMFANKESMNFALYNNNWMDMSVKSVTIENLRMKISIKRMVNMEMFADLYFDGSLSPVIFFKLLIPEIPYVCHLFLTCYLFSNVNEQKESMNFALYSSDWTGMSVKFKELLLCTMRMNDAENLKMKISLQRIVDMEMFANKPQEIKIIFTMIPDNRIKYIMNIKLMKFTGLYQLLNPDTPKSFGCAKNNPLNERPNDLKNLMFIIQDHQKCMNSYYYLDDTNELMSHFMLVVAFFFSTLKIFWVSKNSKRIWNNMDMTSINFLKYTDHKKEILQNGRAKSILTTILFVILWSSVTVAWSISPFLIKDVYLNVKFKDEIRRFRYNSLNYVYPISEEFFNGHFLYFYVVEMLQAVIWGHGTVAYDTFVISICISIAFQLKTIAVSYISLNNRNSDKKNINDNDLEAFFNLKLLIQDQQNMF
ncbi:hypothetical protein ACI65C_007260, partial [Semiaphis heraclei]